MATAAQGYAKTIPIEITQDSILMQAIIAIASNQYQNSIKIDVLENSGEILRAAVQNLSEQMDNSALTKELLEEIVKDCMRIKPEDIMLANTMGYRYQESIDTMSMKEIRQRLSRIKRLYDRNCSYSWEQRLFKSIGKNRNEIKLEAQAKATRQGKALTSFTLHKAVEEIPEYLKWGTAILLEIERENSIYCKPYTRYELLRGESREFDASYIENMDKDSFEAWLQKRYHDCADMCHVDEKKARDLLYNSLRLYIEKRQFDRRDGIRLSDLSGNPKKDILDMCNGRGKFQEIKNSFIYIIISCLVI